MHWRLLVFVFLSFNSYSQKKYKLLVNFTDKNQSEYTLSDPQNYLSERALYRRQIQGIEIKLNDLPVNIQYVDKVLDLGAVSMVLRSKWMNAVLVSFQDYLLIEQVNNLDCVSSVKILDSPNSFHHPDNKRNLEVLNRAALDYGKGDRQVEMHNLHLLHQLGYTGRGMQIAVFDSGFNGADSLEAFEYMHQNGNLLGVKDFVNPVDTDFYQAGHGRSVLSTMAAYLPGYFVGTAPDASYYLFRTEDESSETLVEEFNWLAAAEYADSLGVDIINSSLGYTTFNDSLENHNYNDMDGNTTIVTKAADWAASKGILVVNSAGNSGNGSWHYVGAPADADSILTIGAVAYDSSKAPFSSFGPTFDGRIKPTVVARGLNAYVIDNQGERSTSNGTSFSSPIIAGAAACLWQAYPKETNMSIINYIQRFGHQADSPDSLLGYGIPNFYNAYLELENRNYFVPLEYIDLYPNPIMNQFTINYFSQSRKLVELAIYDVLGRKVLTQFHEVKEGRNRIEVSVDWGNYSDSIYVIQINYGGQLLSKKILKF